MKSDKSHKIAKDILEEEYEGRIWPAGNSVITFITAAFSITTTTTTPLGV